MQTLVEDNRFGGNHVLVALAETLRPRSKPALQFEESQSIQIVVAERHPLPSHDDALVEFARTVPCHCRIVHHVALDEPPMQVLRAATLCSDRQSVP